MAASPYSLSLSWNIYLGGSQLLCHEHPMKKLFVKELRPSAHSHVSKPGSRSPSQIKPSDDYTLAKILTAVSWETMGQNYQTKPLPESCQIILYINIFLSKMFIWKRRQNLGFPHTPIVSSETEKMIHFCCFKWLSFRLICYAAKDN